MVDIGGLVSKGGQSLGVTYRTIGDVFQGRPQDVPGT